MDINLPGINGIEATREILADAPDTVVILLSTYNAGDLPADAATCGAADYVHKEDFSPDEVRRIWDAADHGLIVSAGSTALEVVRPTGTARRPGRRRSRPAGSDR